MPKRKRTTEDTVAAIKAAAIADLADSGLTLKRQAFIEAYLDNGGNASAAYRAAYNAENMSDDAIRVEAYRLRKDPHIALTIERCRQGMAADAALTFEQHMIELARLRDIAKEHGRYGAAVRAEFLRGKLCGFYSDKAEINARDEYANMSDAELRAAILAQDETLRALGIELTPTPRLITGPKKR